VKCGRGRRLWINPAGQLDAAAAGAELLEPLDEVELDLSELDLSDDDFSDDFSDVEEELVDSELLEEPLDELLAEALADSRLSVR
jgi:hypothetical protein